MSVSDHWMPLYVGDYLADTMHLTTAQHGAYLLLIMHYWRTGPLPEDDWELAGICRLRVEDWRRRVKGAVLQFFNLDPPGTTPRRFKHRRIDAELARHNTVVEKRRLASEKRWKPQKVDSAGDDPNGMQMHSKCNANAMQVVVQPQPPKKERKEERESNTHTCGTRRARAREKPLAALAERDPDFAEFWENYPRKVSKGQARRAWQTALRKESAGQIIAALLRYPWPPSERFIPHPATWLNGERWLDRVEHPDAAMLRAAGLDPDDYPDGLTPAMLQ